MGQSHEAQFAWLVIAVKLGDEGVQHSCEGKSVLVLQLVVTSNSPAGRSPTWAIILNEDETREEGSDTR